jgi:FkbM family methyltransferase
MSKVKDLVKHTLFKMISGKKGYSDLRVLTGPAAGVKLRLDLRKEGSYFLGNYDKWIFDRVDLKNIIKPGMVIWDCGSYIGYYTAVFRKIVGDSGYIYTFEASKKNYEIVKTLPGLNNWKNISVLNLAVGPDHTTIKFANNLGGSNGPVGLTKEYNTDNIEVEEIQCCGVDELVYEMNIKAPDLIKFDLETAEEYALHNGENVFTKKRPKILLELHGRKAMNAAAEFIEKYNYSAVSVWSMPSLEDRYSKQSLMASAGVPHMLYCWPN